MLPNTNNHFGSLEQVEIRKPTFVIADNLFLENRPILNFVFLLSPLQAFSSLLECQLLSAGKGNIGKLKILPLLHIETAKSVEPWNKTRK